MVGSVVVVVVLLGQHISAPFSLSHDIQSPKFDPPVFNSAFPPITLDIIPALLCVTPDITNMTGTNLGVIQALEIWKSGLAAELASEPDV